MLIIGNPLVFILPPLALTVVAAAAFPDWSQGPVHGLSQVGIAAGVGLSGLLIWGMISRAQMHFVKRRAPPLEATFEGADFVRWAPLLKLHYGEAATPAALEALGAALLAETKNKTGEEACELAARLLRDRQDAAARALRIRLGGHVHGFAQRGKGAATSDLYEALTWFRGLPAIATAARGYFGGFDASHPALKGLHKDEFLRLAYPADREFRGGPLRSRQSYRLAEAIYALATLKGRVPTAADITSALDALQSSPSLAADVSQHVGEQLTVSEASGIVETLQVDFEEALLWAGHPAD